jgi:hypothetical protein
MVLTCRAVAQLVSVGGMPVLAACQRCSIIHQHSRKMASADAYQPSYIPNIIFDQIYFLMPFWLLLPADFTYMQVKDAAFPGLIEEGFVEAAAYIWPGIQKALEAEVVQGSTTAVTISGRSLGAALATLIACRAQVS